MALRKRFRAGARRRESAQGGVTQKKTTDVFTKEKRSEVMRAVKGRDTKPEVALRKKLFALGLRYRLNVKELPGKPDLVFPK
ncbi:MAG: hypothetical protein KAH44_11955, partial [Oricola sp.]|nr:hypothetical protein [Oricola sp.]